MWTLRRASISIKRHALNSQTFRACGSRTEISSFCIEDNAESAEQSDRSSVSVKKFYRAPHDSPKSFIMSRRFLSSQAGKKSSDEEEDDDDVMIGKAWELSDNDDDEVEEHNDDVELSDTENDASEKGRPRRTDSLPVFKNILAASGVSVGDVMDKWVEEGNDVSRSEILQVMLGLRKRRMFGRALQLSQWLETSKKIEFTERDYASRVDLIAKVRGIHNAESYINTSIPKSFKTEMIYRTLLANCVIVGNVKKAEDIFNKMKDLEFTITPFACNQLLLLYKKVDKRKIADVLLLMEKENVKPNLFTYKILIDIKGMSNDIDGLDQIVETMISEGVHPDVNVQAVMARHYASAGLNEKAEAVLKEMEGKNLKENRFAIHYLLPLYAAIGKAEEVSRIWKICKSNPRLDECMAAIESYGKLKKIEDAEQVFDQMSKKWKKLSAKHYTALLRVYASHQMLNKGKDIVKKMSESGCLIGPLAWDALVKLYVDSGEVEKADSVLYKATQQNKFKPMFNSFFLIMNQYAKRGDVHNTEKMFLRMKQAGYEARIRQFQCLLEAYVNAKKPGYGMRDRMRADNVFPNKAMAVQLSLVDGFRKNSYSDLLD